MKDETDNRSDCVKFEDDLAALIDAQGKLTISEIVGVLELQSHVLKCRYYPPKIRPQDIE